MAQSLSHRFKVHLSTRQCLGLSLLSGALALLLAEIYQGMEGWANLSSWLSCALVNSLLAGLVLLAPKACCQPRLASPASGWLFYLPAVVVLCLAFALGLSSQASFKFWQPFLESQSAYILAIIFWIPLIEEVVFRQGIGGLCKRLGGSLWGSYYSVFIFTSLHSMPSIARLLNGQVDFFLGPFLLASACELLYGCSGSLLPAIFLHMACNTSAVVLQREGGFWLEKLAFLYR